MSSFTKITDATSEVKTEFSMSIQSSEVLDRTDDGFAVVNPPAKTTEAAHSQSAVAVPRFAAPLQANYKRMQVIAS